MLAVIIPTVWLAIATFFVLLCRMASQSDAHAARAGSLGFEKAAATPQTARSPLGGLAHREPSSLRRARPARRTFTPQRASHSGRQRS